MSLKYFSSIFLMLICMAAHAAEAGNLLKDDEARDVEAVISKAIDAGFPDATKALVYMGTLSVKATFDPSKDPNPLPSAASRMQMTGENGQMTYFYEFGGVHLKLADGSWVISLALHFTPNKGAAVNPSKAQEIDLKTLTATALAAKPFKIDDAKEFIEGFPVGSRERAKLEMERYVPVSNYLELRPDYFPIAVLLLQRAGWSDAAGLSLGLADFRASNYWQRHPWDVPDLDYDPTGAYAKSEEQASAWAKANPQPIPEPPATALRRGLFRWGRTELMAEVPEETMLPLPVAAAVSKTCVDPGDPQHFGEKVDRMLAGAKLPVTPAANADLPGRLQSWEAQPRKPRMQVSGASGGGA